jgi:Rieske Fe-S protein
MTEEVDPSRRGFLKAVVGLSAVAAVGGLGKLGVQNLISPAVGLKGFPETELYWNDPKSPTSAPVPLKASEFEIDSPTVWIYYYPLSDEPNFLIRFKDKVDPCTVTIDATGSKYTFTGGVGPSSTVNGVTAKENSIVSYSAICQHLGCIAPIIRFYPISQNGTLPANVQAAISSQNITHGVIHCDCHGSTYDPFKGAGIITHPTERPLPFVTLVHNKATDTLYAKKLTGSVVFGHPSDLTGGHAISNLGKTTMIKLASS